MVTDITQKKCNEFIEQTFKCKKALLTHSCTAALEMAAILLDIQQGDEIIMPSYTFVSTANAFVLRGGVPVFIDIKPDTLNINEEIIEKAITPKTKAICCVHYAGEDMCLSTTLRNRRGIKTFVPPHPTRHHDIWGSLPEYAVLLGNNKVAISHESDNKDVRQNFINELIEDGYTFLANTNTKYVNSIFKRIKFARLLSKYIPNKKFRHFLRGKLNELFLK